ncbi:hypothetical protein DV515_00018370 [Chloebia gouldiae]|uniref:Uncharacterized protein n=1 Tax=Chloebia gouldiae TaxID=44316 RepID=A0A3L8Q7P2_CHLGU|nr:hypothetical protein DV515_00018370 [Chloebia gouldiae]
MEYGVKLSVNTGAAVQISGNGITESSQDLTETVDASIDIDEGFELRPWNGRDLLEQFPDERKKKSNSQA